jgi:hypothetical protein
MKNKNKFYKKYKIEKNRNLTLEEIAYLSQIPVEKIKEFYVKQLDEFDLENSLEKTFKFVLEFK